MCCFNRLLAPVCLLGLLACESGEVSPLEPGASTAIPQHLLGATSSDGLTYPVVGTTSQGSLFRGTVTITGARLDGVIGPVLQAVVSGKSAGSDRPTDEVSLNFEPVELEYGEQATADEDCVLLELALGTLIDPLTKQSVRLEPLQVSTRTLPGPGHLIRDTICMGEEIRHRYELTATP